MPLHVAVWADEVGTLAASCAQKTNPKMGSDLTVAAALARAAVEGALANVEINWSHYPARAHWLAEIRSKAAELRNKQN